jgi:hypothetical protein
MESGIANRLNSLYVLYYNLEKKFNDYLSKNETDSSIKDELEEIKDELINIKINNDSSIKCELEEIKGEIKSIKEENNLSINRELEIVNGELKIIKKEKNYKIKDELDKIKNTINSITHELRHQKNINLDTPNYLEYTLLYADFENCGICMYCPSEPYEPENDISSGPIIDNEKYNYLKNILNN